MSKTQNYENCQSQSKQDLIMESLTRFFHKNPENICKMLPILNKSANISLRILDWFVTNYAKKYNVHYPLPRSGKNFNVYLNYKAQLKAYSKKLFDPFCRKWRKQKGHKIYDGIEFHYDSRDSKKFIETTVGQLNFFKWAITNQVLDYIIEHLTEIVDDMIFLTKNDDKNTHKKKKNNRSNNTGRTKKTSRKTKSSNCVIKTTTTTENIQTKRKELSISATRTITKQHIKVIVSFD